MIDRERKYASRARRARKTIKLMNARVKVRPGMVHTWVGHFVAPITLL